MAALNENVPWVMVLVGFLRSPFIAYRFPSITAGSPNLPSLQANTWGFPSTESLHHKRFSWAEQSPTRNSAFYKPFPHWLYYSVNVLKKVKIEINRGSVPVLSRKSWSVFQRDQCLVYLHPPRTGQPKITLKPIAETANLAVLIPTGLKITLSLLSY